MTDSYEIDHKVMDGDLPDESDATQFLLRYQQIILLYESVIDFLSMRFDLIDKECRIRGVRSPIRSVSSRIKKPQSIKKKLKKLNAPLSIASIQERLNDIAGVRVICEYICDIYRVREVLLADERMNLLREKDYIQNPKPNGYRSLHLIVSMPIPMRHDEKIVKCEIQLRTTAMDCWAGLEHNLRYKKDRTFIALILATGGNVTIAEVEDCIFIHYVLPFLKYRNDCIGIMQEQYMSYLHLHTFIHT